MAGVPRSLFLLRDLPPAERPREKLLRFGATGLTEVELLALLLGTGTPGEPAPRVAGRVLAEGGVRALAGRDVASLAALHGIGEVRAARIVAAFELGRRATEDADRGETLVQTPEDVYRLLPEIRRARKEHFVALFLNARNHLVRKEVISIGSLNASIVHPREVFQPAILDSAAAVVLSHNHPSGDVDPSEDDLAITRRLREAGDLLGIAVLDHVIVGARRYRSLKEAGLI